MGQDTFTVCGVHITFDWLRSRKKGLSVPTATVTWLLPLIPAELQGRIYTLNRSFYVSKETNYRNLENSDWEGFSQWLLDKRESPQGEWLINADAKN